MISNSSAPVNPLPSQMQDQIVKSVLAAAPTSSKTGYVALDADGTLWLQDAGEFFFRELIERQLVSLPEDPEKHYQNLKAQHPPIGYTWLAQILQGHTLMEIRSWALQCFKERELTLFEDIRALIENFRGHNLEVWVVTASVQWVVEVAVQLHKLPVTGVLGVTTSVEKGIVTDQGVAPVTWREGKAQALLATKTEKPLFCAGNTTGDIPLLELSATPPLALHSHKAESPLQASELELQKIAKERGWLTHTF